MKEYEETKNKNISLNDKLEQIKLLEEEQYKKAFLEIFNIDDESDSNISESSPTSPFHSPSRKKDEP